jgi:hypothetical protein
VIHHTGHRDLLTQIANVTPREANSPTVFENVRLEDRASSGRYLHIYYAAGQLVAVSFGPTGDYQCWNYGAYSVAGKEEAQHLLAGGGLDGSKGCTKRNSIHTKLNPRIDMGRVADLGAAAAFVGMGVDIGQADLPSVSFVGVANAENSQYPVRARLFAPAGNGSPVVTAATHLREDTTSMLTFRGSNTDAVASSLKLPTMLPGECCPPLPEFMDLSMFRAEQSAEAYIGQLMARSLCEFAS